MQTREGETWIDADAFERILDTSGRHSHDSAETVKPKFGDSVGVVLLASFRGVGEAAVRTLFPQPQQLFLQLAALTFQT